ncbi:MAG: STAS domain-containing protein [Bacillota bacterium]
METFIEKKDEIKIIKLVGDLDGSTAEKTGEKIMNNIEPDICLIFDLEKCKYVSSAGLRVLLIAAKKLKKMDGLGVLANMEPEVEDVMEMTGFSHMLQSCATTEKAVDFLRKERS